MGYYHNGNKSRTYISKEDMPNWKRFYEQVTGKVYGTVSREPPQEKNKSKTATVRREGSEPEPKEICTEKV